MEEMINQSANNVEVAEPQEEALQETSVNNSEVADPKPVQDAETNAQYAEMRRNQELNEYRQKLEALEKDPRLSFVETLAGQYGMSVQEYMEAVEQQRKEAERERQRQEYIELGLDPDAFDQVLSKRLEEHPDIQFAREMKAKLEGEERFKQEADELFQEFPDLKPDQIPADVWQLKEQRGLTLLDAYLRVSYKSLGQQKEQEAIQKLQQNAQSTPGALGAGAEHKAGYANMSSADKKALRERVLRGENIEF